MKMTGGCRCGAVRYELNRDVLPPVYCCHCRAYQSWSGSAFTQQAPVRERELATTGELANFIYQTPSGSVSNHRACAKCFTRLFNTNERLPGLLLLRAGTLDDSDRIEPVAHIWTSAKQPWVALASGVPTYAENAPPTDFARLLQLP